MSDRDESTGQFTATEPAFGQEGIEREAGYVPFKEEPDDNAELTVKEAAEQYEGSHTAESEIRTYGLDLPDNMTLSVDQAAKIADDVRAADDEQAEHDDIERLRKEVDELRGLKPEGEAKDAKADAPRDPVNDGELEPDLEKALSHPRIREAITAQVAEAETARQTYSKGLDTANEFARASFMQNFPEIMALPLEQWAGALGEMAQREPGRFQGAMGQLQRVVQLQEAQQQERQQQTQREQTEFRAYAQAEDRRFAELTKDIAPKEMSTIEAHIPKMLKDLGVDPGEWLRLGAESKFLRSAAAQKIMVKAAQYDLMKAENARLKASLQDRSIKELPRVQRPGTSRPAGQVNSERMQHLSRKPELSIKEATELLALQSSRRG
jgi:hypothetical protein